MKEFLTKKDLVYNSLKKKILSGKLAPGDRLIISQIAVNLGVSIIPVREAITKLSMEGLVLHLDHRDTFVSPIRAEELEADFLIRAELEGLATFLAIDNLSPEDFMALEKNINKMRQAVTDNELEKLGSINKTFHRIIYKACPHKKIYNMIFDLWANIDRMQNIFVISPQRAESSLLEHIEILAALKQRKKHRAKFLIKKQKLLAWRALESYVARSVQGQIDHVSG